MNNFVNGKQYRTDKSKYTRIKRKMRMITDRTSKKYYELKLEFLPLEVQHTKNMVEKR